MCCCVMRSGHTRSRCSFDGTASPTISMLTMNGGRNPNKLIISVHREQLPTQGVDGKSSVPGLPS